MTTSCDAAGGCLAARIASGQGEVRGTEETGTGKPAVEESPLSQVIQSINERFGTDFDAADLLSATVQDLMASEEIRLAAVNNDRDNFGLVGKAAVEDALISRHSKHTDFINQAFEKPDIMRLLRRAILDEVFKLANAA